MHNNINFYKTLFLNKISTRSALTRSKLNVLI